MKDHELQQTLAKRFEASDPILFKACMEHFNTMRAAMNEIAQREADALQARERWKKIALDALERAQLEIEKNLQQTDK